MSRLIYACRFDVASLGRLPEVAAAYRGWLWGYYRERRQLADFAFDPLSGDPALGLPERHKLGARLYTLDNDAAIGIRWSYPDDADPGLVWINEARIGQFGDRCAVDHTISIESTDYNLAPARLLFGAPRVIRDVLELGPALIGEMKVQATPYVLRQDDVATLSQLLTSPLRKLPVVVLAPYSRGEPNLIDAEKLASGLAGVAIVVRATHPDVTWDFADEVGRQHSCFDGAARIYWPGFSTNSDPRAHRLFFGGWIEQVGSEAASRTIQRAIFAVSAFRYVADPRIADLVQKVEAAARHKALNDKRASGSDQFLEEYERDLQRLDMSEARVAELERELAILKDNQQALFAGQATASEDDGPDAPVATPEFTSVAEAVMHAEETCPHLEFLPTAHEAAANSPFRRVFDVYQALVDLNEISALSNSRREETGNGGDLLQHLKHKGWGKRSAMHISDTTRKKNASHYEFEYQGKKQLFEPHITLGSGDPNVCASIHFIVDVARAKIVVAHVGRHLPNTKT